MFTIKVKGFIDRGETAKAEELEIISGTGLGGVNLLGLTFRDLPESTLSSLKEGDVITLVLRVE